MSACILAASPRKNGNSDFCASLLRRNGFSGPIVRLADKTIRPCIECGMCELHPGKCRWDRDETDEMGAVHAEMFAADLVCVVSPIFFYGLPGQAKIFVDRAQAWYGMEPAAKPGRDKTLTAVLIAGRKNGDKLFVGAELSLRYMAQALGFTFHKPLLLRGLESQDALFNSFGSRERVMDFAHEFIDSLR